MKSRALLLVLALVVCLAPAPALFAQEETFVSVAEPLPAAPVAVGVDHERMLAFRVAFNQLAEANRFRPLQALKLRRAANDEALCEYLAMRYAGDLDSLAAETAAGDQFFAFIKFIIANQDSILKFVNTLIDLFS